jgi:hypothetical protein
MTQELLVTQRNAVFELIREVGLDPAAFSWEAAKNGNGVLVSRLVHSGRVFFADFDLDRLRFQCCPGLTSRVHEWSMPLLWQHQLREARGWLERMKKELAATDLWEQLRSLPVTVSAASSETEARQPLASTEREGLLAAIEGVRGELGARTGVDAEERRTLNMLLDRIATSTENATKGQVGLIVWGAIVSAIAAGVITVENGKWMLQQLQLVIHWLPAVVTALIGSR